MDEIAYWTARRAQIVRWQNALCDKWAKASPLCNAAPMIRAAGRLELMRQEAAQRLKPLTD